MTTHVHRRIVSRHVEIKLSVPRPEFSRTHPTSTRCVVGKLELQFGQAVTFIIAFRCSRTWAVVVREWCRNQRNTGSAQNTAMSNDALGSETDSCCCFAEEAVHAESLK